MACIKSSTDTTLDVVGDDLTLTANLTRRRLAERLRSPSLRRFFSPFRAKRSENTTYQYDPLAAENNHVRLLTLLSGEPSAKLSVMLNNAPFSTQDPPSYEALSYAWGSTKNPAFVTVGETGSDTIAVTQNLAAALQYLRYRDRPRTLWIDAICVNQTDLAERSRQVQLMGSIYRLAARVIAWVGPEADDSLYALETLELLGTSVEVDWSKKTWKPANSDEESRFWNQQMQPSLSKRQHNAIKSFLFRPWFQRLWVQQEIRLADDNAIIACGLAQLSWNLFRRSIVVILSGFGTQQTLWSLSETFAYTDRLLEVEQLCQPVFNQPLHSSLQSAQHSICSDPRDRLYALLSIHENGQPPGAWKLDIHPNYDAPVSQVYQQATFEIINSSLELGIITACELRPDNMHNLPSWVPDFSRPRLSPAMNTGYTAGVTHPDWDCSAGEILRVRGRAMCSLQTTKSSFVGERTTVDGLKALRQMRPPVSLDTPYVSGGTLLDAYCDALHCGYFTDSLVPPQTQRQRESCTELLRMIWNTELDWDGLGNLFTSDDMHTLLGHVCIACNNRTICTTEQGYITLAPKYAQPGDQVCVFLGCMSSMLLRPAGSRWQVVGECYVPGLTAGEALIGPLPNGYRSVRVLHDGQGQRAWFPRIQNISTQEITEEDPRFDISEYPEGVPRIEVPIWNQYKKMMQMGVQQDLNYARRAYPWREENLKKRGVLLQDFYLI